MQRGMHMMTLSMIFMMMMAARVHCLALGERVERAERGPHHREGDSAPLDVAEVGQVFMDEREAEIRESLLREYEAMQQQERSNAYLALLLDRLRTLPLLPAGAPSAPQAPDFRPQAPPDLLPVAAPLQQQFYRPNPDEKKSSNYISYCHFKICNMGKRKWN